MTANGREPDQSIADYDSNAYDYRTFWSGRDYEQWAESAVLTPLMRRLPPATWFADFGGGFGRNFGHYRDICRHAVLIDYSVNNLVTAAGVHTASVTTGKLHLVRADLAALPFRDGAFDSSMTIRVLHHLREADVALHEMLRTVLDSAIIDVPIKNHVLARARAVARRDLSAVRGPEPRIVGSSEHPFNEFSLPAIQAHIEADGFETQIMASVNNLRRWDQRLPQRAVRVLTPIAHGAEWTLQRVGRGWWGPSQFILAVRRDEMVFAPGPEYVGLESPLADLAPRMCCPSCQGDLEWTPDVATCKACDRGYQRHDTYWDFAR
jgi:hypothetical protein